jgi:hypothetical protein
MRKAVAARLITCRVPLGFRRSSERRFGTLRRQSGGRVRASARAGLLNFHPNRAAFDGRRDCRAALACPTGALVKASLAALVAVSPMEHQGKSVSKA